MKDALVGFNTNVVFHGRTLHVQTEDSGREHPHVITHLFIDGAIAATKRGSYAEALDLPDLTDRVRALMKAQHKAMLVDVKNGVYDEEINRASTSAAEAVVPGAAPQPVVEQFQVMGEASARAASAEPSIGAGRTAARAAAEARPSASSPRAVESARAVSVVPATDGGASEPRRPRRDSRPRLRADREREGFGRDLISDRSLDEVILGYLAEELTKTQK